MSAPRLLQGVIVAGIACGLLFPTGKAVAQERTEVAEQFGCPTCHVTKLKEVRKPTGPLLVDPATVGVESYGKQESASTQRMCFSCHDGFVMDSRFAWSEGHATHPVGVKPPASMKLPEVDDEPVFPLNEDGEVYCGTCHIAHLGEGAAATAPDFLRVSPENGQLCQNCHADKATVAGTPHARVRKSGQPADFSKGGICGRCHAPHDNAGLLLWARTPGQANTPVATLCRSCHADDPAQGEHPAQVLAWSQAVREPLRGKPSVEMPVFDEQARHATRGVIGCPTCHNPHRREAEGLPADVPGKFLRLADTADFLCADCHGSSALFRYRYFHSERRR